MFSGHKTTILLLADKDWPVLMHMFIFPRETVSDSFIDLLSHWLIRIDYNNRVP